MENPRNQIQQQLDKYLPEKIRHKIEQDYYAKITEQAQLEAAMRDPDFLVHPLEHVALLADHGITHVRDVSQLILHLLTTLNGVQFPLRNDAHLEFMKGYGVMVAYLHDIGMINASIEGRDMHPEYSAQAVYGDLFETDITNIWEENCGNVPWRLAKLSYKGLLSQPPRTILREMLSMTCAHSADCISSAVLNHPEAFRRELQDILSHDLRYLWLQKQLKQAREKLVSTPRGAENYDKVVAAETEAQATLEKAAQSGQIIDKENSFLSLFYKDFRQESFQWLIDPRPELVELREDVIDTLRILRAGNTSVRQRSARLRASGSYQIFLDQVSGNAIYSISHEDQTYLLEAKSTQVAGDANIASSDFTEEGDLRISFHRGSFMDSNAIDRVTFNAAVVVNNIQEHMIDSFLRPEGSPTSADFRKKHEPIYILLESTDDNPHFTELVGQQLITLNPQLKGKVRLVPSLQDIAPNERERYLLAKDVGWDLRTRNEVLQKISRSGHKIEKMDPERAFTNVKVIELKPGDKLIEAGSLSSLVYIPLGEGLIGYPIGGFQPFYSHAWVPLGNIGVIRGDIRSATIVAEQKLELLVIPKETYLKHWHFMYTEEEFVQLLNSKNKMKR